MRDSKEHEVQKVIEPYFLVALNAERKITFVNKDLVSLFNPKSIRIGDNFLSLFSKSNLIAWDKTLQVVSTADVDFKDVIIAVENNSTTHIYWRVKKVTDAEADFTGFEISGNLLKTMPAETPEVAIQNNRKVPLQETQVEPEQLNKLASKVEKLTKILNSSLDIICAISEAGQFIKVSSACKDILGYEPSELIGKIFLDFVHSEDLEETILVTADIKNGHGTTNFANRYIKKDGNVAHLSWSSRWEETDKCFYCIARDATELRFHEQALKESEEKYRILFYNHPLPMFIYDAKTLRLLEVNQATVKQYGYTIEELLCMQVRDLLAQDEVSKFDDLHNEEDYYLRNHKGVWMHRKKNGELFYADITSNYIGQGGRRTKLVLAKDCTNEIIAEKELLKTKEKYLFLTEATFDAIYDWDLKTDRLQWNDAIKTISGETDIQEIGRIDWWYNKLHPEDRERVETKINNYISNRIANWEDEYRFKRNDDTYKYIYDRRYIIYDESSKPVRMIGAMQDLTERKQNENVLKRLNNSLEKRAKELAESNAELERFAYVASHDLQEPLRMVTSFLQLLEKRYKDKLDQKAKEYITFAVDGAERMKKLILDLLEYSRVNSSKIEKEDIDLNQVIRDVKLTYKSLLKETEGTITSTDLPTIKGNKTQILQLFQNLVGNAFKYRSEATPEVNISFEEEALYYKFLITDNGIGIDPKFFNKIFIIFQRLHNREQYSGTGIGLAICKKIIDKHGGKIWLNSALGQGSTFYFTIPKSK